MSFKSWIHFFKDEEAQATLEYILIVSVLISIAILLVRDLVRPLVKRMTDTLTDLIENKMFNADSMHRSPFRR